MGKGEIAHYEQFLLFPQCFQKARFPGASKGSLCGNGLRFNQTTFQTCPYWEHVQANLACFKGGDAADTGNQNVLLFLHRFHITINQCWFWLFSPFTITTSIAIGLPSSNPIRFEMYKILTPGSVFTNHSLEHSLSYSPEFHNLEAFECNRTFDWLYGLANQKLCYIPISKFWRKRQRLFLRMVGEYRPW